MSIPLESPANLTLAVPPPIHPDAVYTPEQARFLFSPPLPPTCLGREIRSGRLRAAKRAGRLFVLGRWLIEWIEAAEVHRQPDAANGNANGDGRRHNRPPGRRTARPLDQDSAQPA